MSRASVLCVSVCLAAGVQSVSAGTVKVPQDHATITEALAEALPGDTVLVDSGRYAENLTISRPVHLLAVSEGESEVVPLERAVPVVKFDAVAGPSSFRGFKIDGLNIASAGVEASESSVDVVSNEIFASTLAVFFRRSEGRIEGNVFRMNAGGELRLYGSSPVVARNRFEGGGAMAVQIVGKNSVPIIGGTEDRGNVFGPGYGCLISCETKNDINARYNEWSWSTTVEMNAQGYPSNLTAVYDGFDDPRFGKVDFRDWVGGEGGAGPRRTMMWLIPVVGVLMIVLIVTLRRAHGRS